MHKRCSLKHPTAIVLALIAGLLVLSRPAPAQINGPSELDHLKCYRIRDSLAPTQYVADLRNQFGLEPGCVIGLPARLLCAETDKRIIGPTLPPGGGPSGDAAGHFLCYFVRCPQHTTPEIRIEDQFGRRTIAIAKERLLCAPADKLICGDGDLDPGEACDPGSAATNVCPDGSPCTPACTCPPGVCCQCPDDCAIGSGTICPSECVPVAGAVCTDAGRCETCPCGTPCFDAAGNAGECRPTGSAPLDPCECMTPPRCECGSTCTTPDGQAGLCRQLPGQTECTCEPIDLPCECGTTCVAPNGVAGLCQPTATGACECRPVSDCPCGTSCTAPDGTAGVCRPNTAGICECRSLPQCPCGTICTSPDGTVGQCRPVPGSDACLCQAPPDCPCGKPCLSANGNSGRCHPVHGSSGTCACREL